MRGSKGGFWNRLVVRFRLRKLNKNQKLELEKEEKLNSKKEKIIKIKKEEQELYFLSSNKIVEGKSKKRVFKGPKKGIPTKIVTYNNIGKKEIKKHEIPDLSNYSIKIERKNKKKNDISPKIENKNVSIITSKNITKKKKGILNNKITSIKDNSRQLNEKSQKLIDELNKIINDNREKINLITDEITELKCDLNGAKTIKKVEEIEKKLNVIKKKLIELMETYTKIKNDSISKLKDEEIEKLVTDIKNLDSNFKFDKIINTVATSLG